MTKFTRGDTVLCVLGNVMPDDCEDSRIYKGDKYSIQRVHGKHIVNLLGVRGGFSVDRFVLVRSIS